MLPGRKHTDRESNWIARCPGLYRWGDRRNPRVASTPPLPINPIKTHYENVNDKTLQATGNSSAFLHRY